MAVSIVSTRAVALAFAEGPCLELDDERFIVLREKSCGSFSQTYSEYKEWATNRWGGLVQTEEGWCTAEALGRVMIEGRFGSGSPFPGYYFLDVEGS